MGHPIITSFTLGDYQTNCFIVQPEPDARSCWIVDCGFDPEPLLDHITTANLDPVGLLLTHCHSDHMAGVDAALSRYGPMPMHVHEAERGFCSDPMLNLSGMIGRPVTCQEPDQILHDGDELTLGDSTWRVVHTPGHSPGGVMFVHDDSKQAIVGDVIFAGSIGRHDFPTSNVIDLRRSVLETVMALPDDMKLYPGHGPETTVGAERVGNPFVVGGF